LANPTGASKNNIGKTLGVPIRGLPLTVSHPMSWSFGTGPVDSPRQRIFNVPRVVLAILAAIGLIHAFIAYGLDDEQTREMLIVLAFIPARYNLGWLATDPWWIGWGPTVWTFVTYAFIHIDFNHLFFNGIILVAFGTPVARRFGATRFLIFFLVTAAAGAAAHLAVHFGDRAPVIGASASVSGAMAAAIRFIFQQGGPISALGSGDPHAYWVPAAPLRTMLRDRRLVAFLAVWFATNLLFGQVSILGTDQIIAWEAHIGGFLAGLIGFALFDPPPPPLPPPPADEEAIEGHEPELADEFRN
jgi:membrane associated rhomboid family serine protease